MGFFRKWFRFKEGSSPSVMHKRVNSVVQDKELLTNILATFELELTGDGDHVLARPDTVSYRPFNYDVFGEEQDTFLNWWSSAGYVVPRATEGARRKRYKDYDYMVSNSPEISLAHETYVDETLSTVKDDKDFIIVEVLRDGKEDKPLTDEVNESLRRAGLFTNAEGILEGMCKYGDHFVPVYFRTTKKDKEEPQKDIDDKFRPNKPLQIKEDEEGEPVLPDMSLHILTSPEEFERTNFPNTDIPHYFKYQQKTLYPWEVIHFRMLTSDKNFIPYGKSCLERMRSSYKQLLINESLLALSRASKIERLVVKVPVGGTTPESIFARLMESRTLFKNAIFGEGTKGRPGKTKPHPTALTEVLFLPASVKGDASYEIDRIGSTIDITSTDDVDYFRNKLLIATRIPRPYFDSEEHYQAYRKLVLQDLKFARFIAKIQKSFAAGCVTYSKIYIGLHGKWENNLEVKVKYRLAAPMANEELNNIRDAIDTASTMLQTVMDTLGLDTVPKELLSKALQRYVPDMAKDILELIDTIKVTEESTEDGKYDFKLVKKTLSAFSGYKWEVLSSRTVSLDFNTYSKDSWKKLEERVLSQQSKGAWK